MESIVSELKAERGRIDAAIKALSGISVKASGGGGAKRTMSAAARAKISAAQRERWQKFKAAKKKG